MDYKLKTPIKGTIGQEKYRCTIEWRNGKIIADEIPEIGGNDAGPDPVTLLLSSITSSILIMLRIYIDSNQWDIPEIAVSTNLYEEFKDDVVTTIIDRDIVFISNVSEENKTKLLEIAKNCPVTTMLQGNLKMRTFVYRDGETRKTIKYPNKEITVLWKPEFCQHSTRCWKQLPSVFDPTTKQWINAEGAPTDKIIEQLKKCPSGALTYTTNENLS